MAYSLGRSGRGLFTGTAWHYAQYRPGYPKPFFDSIVAQFALDGTNRLLDLGCGTGQLTLPLAEHVTEAVGMDPEPEMLTEAARQAQAARVTNVTWAQGSSEDLPGNIGRFKLVTMGRSFHWMNREQVLTVLDGMVDDDGGLVIANDSCLVRPTTQWQRAIEDIQNRFLPPETPTNSTNRATTPEPHEAILARSPFGTCTAQPMNSTAHGRSNTPSDTSTRPRCPFTDYSANTRPPSNKPSPTHSSRSTPTDCSLSPSP